MPDIEALKAAIPPLADTLAKRMVDEALRMYVEVGLSLDVVMPTVTTEFMLAGDKRLISLSLSLDWVTDET